jgi:hypothetical protein
MKQVKIYCDKCGEVVPDNKPVRSIEVQVEDYWEETLPDNFLYGKAELCLFKEGSDFVPDLCRGCFVELFLTITNKL